VIENINKLVWLWGVFVLGLFIDISYQVMVFLAIDKAYNTKGKRDLSLLIINEWLTFVAANAVSGAIAGVWYDSWNAA